jgi:hypothetical protein
MSTIDYKALYEASLAENKALTLQLQTLQSQTLSDKNKQTQPLPQMSENELTLTDKPLCNYFKTYQIDAHQYKDPTILFNEKKSTIIDKINQDVSEYRGIKFSIGISLKFFHEELNGEKKEVFGQRHSEQCAIMDGNNTNEFYDKQIAYLQEWIEKFTNTETGLEIEGCTNLYLNIAKYEPLRGSSYIPLPKALENKKAIINVKNDDNKCIEWAIKAALYSDKFSSKEKNETSRYKRFPKLNLDVDFPTPISQIPKIEKQLDLAINVYGFTINKANIFPYYISSKKKEERINLLLIQKDENYHYCWIKNLNRLLYDQTKHKERKYFCERCLHGFSKEILLINHKNYCEGINKSSTRIDMPIEGKNHIKFENHQNQMPVPFVIYADFESIIRPKTEHKGDKTEITSEHEACGFGYIVVRYDGVAAEKPVIYRGSDAAGVFLNNLDREVEKINNIFKNPKPIIMTEDNNISFQNAIHCWICNKEFYKDNNKVKDHCHFTGKYRGAAHKSCNLKLSIKMNITKIPVVFHNLRGYDSHIIMKSLHKSKGNITCIANNSEKYISFGVGQLKFIDSFQFMSSSLEKLVDSTNVDEFRLINQFFNNKTELIIRKGVYPYEYIDSHIKFNETSLPPIEKFYSSLRDESINQSEYDHAQSVWKSYDCKTLGDYHDLYLKTDVLLLADVFQTFRKTCMNEYKLDPAHYYTAPGLSWDALLKYTKIDLELLTDLDMHLFIEKGMRGGISMVSKRSAKANNPLVEDYNPDIDKNYILYLDANNLYGYAMNQPLPYSGFKWVEKVDSKQKNKGWILEVDLEYPTELHKYHNDYPLAPEKLSVKKEWISEYQKELLENDSLLKIEKLVPNLMDKKKYIVHYKNLQLYIKLGMKLVKIHRILEFNEKPWMEPYITLNTELRKKAKSTFEKDFYKLMNNSVFGKTMENPRKRLDIKIVKTDGKEKKENEKIRKLIAKPNFNRRIKFSDDLSAIQMNKTKLSLNKPIYVGFSVLDLSKHLMYDWYYNKLKKNTKKTVLFYIQTRTAYY